MFLVGACPWQNPRMNYVEFFDFLVETMTLVDCSIKGTCDPLCPNKLQVHSRG